MSKSPIQYSDGERPTMPRDSDGRVIEFPRQHHPSEQSFRGAVGCWICYRVRMRYTGHEEVVSFDSRYNNYRLALEQSVYDYDRRCDDYYVLMFPNGHTIKLQEIESWIPLPLCELAHNSMSVPNTGSRETSLLAAKWLQTCQESHEECQHKTESNWRPTRLLHISENYIRLICPQDESGFESHYATLSYCWGSKEFLVLNSKTITEFQDGVPLNRLPRTFQETIITVRAFNIDYLWIDSCCILQGEDEDAKADWIQEAHKMQEVYSQSYLNILSTDSASPLEGLFRSRRLRDSKSIFLRWKRAHSQLRRYHYITDTGVKPEWWSSHTAITNEIDGLSWSRIISRAWVLQEIVLSTRLLMFSNHTIHWQCNHIAASENFPQGIPAHVA
ncbi:heterokaryon incompatibility protein-domain-containing protein [Hypoxylon sp. FL1150]|nr:heterokaryon incompatibility protein-domain-containing protein [Hypoxylon sp. FL1150]